MIIERNLFISLLKLTKDGPVLIKNVNRSARIPSDIAGKMLEQLQNEDIICMEDDSVVVDSENRLKLAVRAATLGADVEHISSFLRWQEFEDFAALALERNGYVAAKNVRFKHVGRRWEIDVVGCRKPIVLCIDCKHWQRRLKPSALNKIVEAQVGRTNAFADTLPSAKLKIQCTSWNEAKFVPVILSLIPSNFKYYNDVPVVPVLQLQDFISQLPAYVQSLKHSLKEFKHL